jgi:hypothetical protein
MLILYNRMKLPNFGLKLISSSFGSGFEYEFESGSETFISVPDRIRPKVSDPSGSGSVTLQGNDKLPEDHRESKHIDQDAE